MDIQNYNDTNTCFFVSGMFAGNWMWDDVFPHIPNTNHFLIKEPLCGISGKLSILSSEIIQEIKNIQAPVTLIGNSLGAFIALDVARLMPDKIKNVIISGSAGFAPVIKESLTLEIHNPNKVGQQLMNLIYSDENAIPEKYVRNISACFGKHARNIVKLMRESNAVDVEQVLKDVRCPVHAIWGANDIVTPFSTAIEAINQYNITYDLIDECGHSPMLEKPAEFTSLLSDQMRKINQISGFRYVA